MNTPRWLVVAVCAASVVLGGCAGAESQPADVGQPLPTPQRSASTAVAGTVALVTNALGAAGFQAYPPVAAYRPSEPVSLTQVPRAVLQISSPDPDQGFVVIYDFATNNAAATAGAELADYVGSGFGQTNFPTDAQFSVAQVGSTVVFTWYSGARADDAATAQAAFEAVRAVGQPFDVVK